MMHLQPTSREGADQHPASADATTSASEQLRQAVLPHVVASGAGLLATFPMTGVMLWSFRHLPPQERYALPPREIVDQLATKMGVRYHFTARQLSIVTILAHFGMGMSGGLLYSLTVERLNKNPVLQGIGYGISFWAANYLLLMPAFRLLTPATKHPPRRNALMIQAHVVWGVCLGLLASVARPMYRLGK